MKIDIRNYPWFLLLTSALFLTACSSDLGRELPGLEAQTNLHTLRIPIGANADDAEETTDGIIRTGKSVNSLAFSIEGGVAQTVGLRFAEITIPKGSKITRSYIDFRASVADSRRVSLLLRGVDADNVSVFTTEPKTITSRRTTSASSTWRPNAWKVGQATRTSELASIVQEIVDRDGWQAGNAIAFVVTSDSKGKRSAVSRDASATNAPILHITYEPAPQILLPPPTSSPLTHSIGYLPFWMHSSGMASIRQNYQRLTEVSPFWYRLNADGSIGDFSDAWYVKEKEGIVSELRSLGLKVTPTLANVGSSGFSASLTTEVLRNHQTAHIANIVNLVMSKGYDGIDIDYEKVADTDRDVFIAFIRDLAKELHVRGKTLSVVSYAKTSDNSRLAYDLAELGRYADQIRLMLYTYRWTHSNPGSISPLDFMSKALTYASSKMPKGKVIAGLGFFGIDWIVGNSGRELTYTEIMNLARRYGPIVYRDSDGTPWFRYNDGREREVWFEDAHSLAAKQNVATEHQVGGVMFWHLGDEDAQVWRSNLYLASTTD